MKTEDQHALVRAYIQAHDRAREAQETKERADCAAGNTVRRRNEAERRLAALLPEDATARRFLVDGHLLTVKRHGHDSVGAVATLEKLEEVK